MIQPNPTIRLSDRHQHLLGDIIDRAMAGCRGAVLLFGSRARGTARPGSDIDLAVRLDTRSPGAISALREYLEQSTLPFTADVIDLGECGPAIENEVKREGVVVWER